MSTPGATTSPPPRDSDASGRWVLTVNGGSSSIKFALFSTRPEPERLAGGQIDRIGQPGSTLSVSEGGRGSQQKVDAADHRRAAEIILEWVERRAGPDALGAIGHRLVHGGLKERDHQPITPQLLDDLRGSVGVDLAHLPREIALIEACRDRFPALPQVACFDTAFHRTMPRVARLLPIPREYADRGLRRFGFHGLSYTYLMEALARLDPPAARGRVVLAHLGSGASMAAVRGGEPVDTTMGFTPLAGLVMGTRPGDLDPGLLAYLVRSEKFDPDALDDFLSRRCGLLGVSGTTADMRDLVAAAPHDPRAADAVDLFCYRARQWVGALAASLGGLDALVFAGGIGEKSPEVRARVCDGLGFLGVAIDPAANAENAAVISPAGRPVTVRVIPTDEEAVMARIVVDVVRAGDPRRPREGREPSERLGPQVGLGPEGPQGM